MHRSVALAVITALSIAACSPTSDDDPAGEAAATSSPSSTTTSRPSPTTTPAVPDGTAAPPPSPGPAQPDPWPRLAEASPVTVPGLELYTVNDWGERIYLSAPQLEDHPVFNEELRRWADERVEEHRQMREETEDEPELASLSGRLTIIGASEEVIGFGLSTRVNDGQEVQRSRETTWYDPREEKVLSWPDLIAAEHRDELTDAVLSRLEEPSSNVDTDAAQELLEEEAALLGFAENGQLLVGFEEGAVAPSYRGAPAVTFPQAHDDGWLTDLGQAAREATLEPLVGQVPTLEPLSLIHI